MNTNNMKKTKEEIFEFIRNMKAPKCYSSDAIDAVNYLYRGLYNKSTTRSTIGKVHTIMELNNAGFFTYEEVLELLKDT